MSENIKPLMDSASKNTLRCCKALLDTCESETEALVWVVQILQYAVGEEKFSEMCAVWEAKTIEEIEQIIKISPEVKCLMCELDK